MWPKLLDLPAEQCKGMLRNLECQAYTSLVDAYRAGGVLTEEKKSSLESVAAVLNISGARHKAEVRRAVNDEVLNTISERLCGLDKSYSWAKEGRRIIPILPRSVPLTALTELASTGSQQISLHNSGLARPSQTRTKAAPVLARPDHLLSPPSLSLSNGAGPEVKTEEEDEGLVVLPSGTVVKVSAKSSSRGGRGGKRRRTTSKSYEVLSSQPSQRAEERREDSPPRKVSSVLGAGHGYARPLPTPGEMMSLEPSQHPAGQTARVRGPGRPPGPSLGSPGLTVGAAGVYQQVMGRGRPRLLSGAVRGRVCRGRGGVLITPRLASSQHFQSAAPVLLPSSASASSSVSTARLSLRPTSVASPRATTIQLKQEASSLQGLKVISHSNTKIVPKSATAVYVVPSSVPGVGTQQRIITGQRLPGVIKTVRPGKPSVIVVQKGSALPAVSGGVALYRPTRAVVCNPRATPTTSSNNLILVNISQSETATTDVGPVTTAPALENQHFRTNGEAQEKTDEDGRTEPAMSDAETPEVACETNNGDVSSGHLDGENNVRSDTIFSSKKVTLPPRTVTEEADTEETEVIPTYDLSTGENITNVLESEILENHQDIVESNGDLRTQE